MNTTGNQGGLLACSISTTPPQKCCWHASYKLQAGKCGAFSSAVDLDLTPSGPALRHLLGHSQGLRDQRPKLSLSGLWLMDDFCLNIKFWCEIRRHPQTADFVCLFVPIQLNSTITGIRNTLINLPNFIINYLNIYCISSS